MPKITSQIVFKGTDEGVVVTVRNITKELKELSNTYKKLSKIEQTKQEFSKQFTEALRRQGKTLQDVGLNASQLERASKDYAATLHKSTEEIKINANVTKALTETQNRHTASQLKELSAQNARRRILKRLNDRLKEHGTLLRRVVPDTELMRKAISGNAGAMKKLRAETRKYISEQKVLNKSSLFSIRNLRNMSGSFSVLRSKILLATFAIGLMSKTVGRFIKASSDAEETMNKFGVVFGHVRGEALAFAETLGSTLGRTTTALADMMATVQDTFVPLGFSREASLDLSKALTQLTLDVASFQNKADADVMRAFQSAVVGNHEAVRSFGVIITEAELKAAALRKGIIETSRELSAQEKVLARLSLIFDGTKDAMDDLANTQESYANTVKTLEANLSKLAEVIGEELTPAAKALIVPISFLAEKMGDQKRLQTYLALLVSIASGLSLLAIAFAPIVGAIALMTAKITAGILVFVGLAEAITAFRKRGEEIKEVADITIDYDKILKELKNSIEDVGFAIEDGLSFDKTTAMIKTYVNTLEDSRVKLDLLRDVYKKHAELNSEQAETSKENMTAMAEYIDFVKEAIDVLKESIDPEQKIVDSLRTKIDILKATTEIEKESIRIAVQLGVEAKNLDPTIKQLIEDYIKEKEAVDEANKSKKETIKLADKQKKATERLTAQREKISESFYGKLDELRLSDYDLGIKLLKAEVEEYRKANIKKSDVDDYYRERKAELDAEAREKEMDAQEERRQAIFGTLNEIQGFYSGFASAEKKRVDANLNNELNALKQTHNWRVATTEQREVLEENIRAKHVDDQAKAFKYEKQASLLGATIKAAEAIVNTLRSVPYPFNILAAASIGILAKKQISAIAGTPAPSYERGGMIGGRAHSAGGTMIEAERGEFIIKKKAVNAIGAEYLNDLNDSFQEGGLVQSSPNETLRLTNLIADLGSMRARKWGFDDIQTSSTVRDGVKEGRYQLGGLVDSGIPKTPQRIINIIDSDIPEPSQNIINISISGNVMTDEFTRDKIIPEIQQALRLNLA